MVRKAEIKYTPTVYGANSDFKPHAGCNINVVAKFSVETQISEPQGRPKIVNIFWFRHSRVPFKKWIKITINKSVRFVNLDSWVLWLLTVCIFRRAHSMCSQVVCIFRRARSMAHKLPVSFGEPIQWNAFGQQTVQLRRVLESSSSSKACFAGVFPAYR